MLQIYFVKFNEKKNIESFVDLKKIRIQEGQNVA
jgi:hypothetical protein